jgi:hypothetical protein
MTKISSSSNNDPIRHRPTGVTILGVLFVIAGAFTQLGALTTLDAIPFVADVNSNVIGNSELALGAVLIPLGIEILCIASFVVAYGLFTGRSWAWFVGVVLSIIGLVVNVISLVIANMFTITGALVGIAINAIVLYYLSRRNVRRYFGIVAAPREKSSSTTTTVGVERLRLADSPTS